MHDSDINHKEEKQVAVRPRWDEHGRRCPLTHRKSHTYPQIIRKAISCFPKIWAKALATQQSTFATAKNSCNGEACSSNVGHVNAARSFMRTWLQQRFLDDCRVVYNVQDEAKFLSASLFQTCGKIGDLVGDSRPGAVSTNTGIWDLHMTDFNPSMRAWVKETRSGTMEDAWVQKHGTNLHALSSALATCF